MLAPYLCFLTTVLKDSLHNPDAKNGGKFRFVKNCWFVKLQDLNAMKRHSNLVIFRIFREVLRPCSIRRIPWETSRMFRFHENSIA